MISPFRFAFRNRMGFRAGLWHFGAKVPSHFGFQPLGEISLKVSSVSGETHRQQHRYGMAMFVDWMAFRDVGGLLRLLESAEFFNPQDYNQVFNGQLEKLLTRIHNPDLRQNVEASRGFDWGGYISRSLLRAGFRDDDQQEVFHQIVVKLLVEPGKLFGGWEPRRHGPLEWRFRRSVWNAIRNAQEKTRNRQRWMHTADPSVMAGQFAGRQPPNNIIGEFRALVLQRLGKLALAILDQRLAGQDTKDLVGTARLYRSFDQARSVGGQGIGSSVRSADRRSGVCQHGGQGDGYGGRDHFQAKSGRCRKIVFLYKRAYHLPFPKPSCFNSEFASTIFGLWVVRVITIQQQASGSVYGAITPLVIDGGKALRSTHRTRRTLLGFLSYFLP